MEVPSQHSKHSQCHTVEEYSNLQELISDVEALKNENFSLALKVGLFERYLKKKCPILLAGVDRFMEPTNIRSTMMSINTARSSVTSSFQSNTSRSSSHYGQTSHSLPHSSHSAYRISSVVQIDMIDRELEESQMSMDKLNRRFESAKFLSLTEEENLRSHIKLIKESKVEFENFIKQNTNKKTGRITHDKFLRFIESEMQHSERILQKMKLKAKSLQIEYNHLLHRQERRLELRERLHLIDLDKLIIENKELQDKLEHKTKLLTELKKTVGKKGQYLVAMKSKLNDVLLTLRNIREDIKQKQTKYKFTEEKEIKNVNELITAEIINENIKKLNSSFKSPDAHNYLRIQVKLNELKSEKDVWERRCKYQRQSVDLLEHQVKQLSPPVQQRKQYSTSYRTSRSPGSCKSINSFYRHIQRTSPRILQCTPTTPPTRIW